MRSEEVDRRCGGRFSRANAGESGGRWYAPYDARRESEIRTQRTNVPRGPPELGLNVTTEPKAYGASRNPWNPAHSTGGSSGGSAAAVAALMMPAAHASDGGGSIRIPASECGLVGLKPSRGRVSLGPDYGEYWHGLVISHAVTRSVRDSAAILDTIAGAMPGDPYVAPPPQRPFLAEVAADPGRLRIGVMLRAPGGAPLHNWNTPGRGETACRLCMGDRPGVL